MAAKYLHSLADENPDFRKQIGCMRGVFHIFNRNHIVSRSRILGHNRKKHPPGSLLFNNGTPERESNTSWSPRRPNSELNELSPYQHQNLDLRDKVKDSMYREARGLPPNILVELQEPNWFYNEPTELSRSKSFSKFYPRFSYDGHTTTPKQLKEPPRLSLDSKERSIRIRTLESISLVPIKPFDSRSNLYSRNLISNGDKGLNQIRPPSVVAKLMGLETFQDSKSTSDKNLDLLSKSSKANDDCGSIKRPKSKREPTNMKLISRVPIEEAPWKYQNGGQNTKKSPPSVVSKSSSVYSEVDKRLKNLEFLKSGKDLRALKHILESMQAVEARKGEKDNSIEHQKPPSQESHIVIMKPGKIVEKGFINNNMSKDPITDSLKPSKQSKSKYPNRRQNSSKTEEKSVLLVKVGESEYPSPVSVLDDSVYVDNSPSPFKHTPKDYPTQNLAENFSRDQYESTNDFISSVTSQINREKLQKVEHLVQKLKRLNSTHDESHTDYIASLCENTNPNSRYISEIFLASGLLLRDLESFKFHSSNHPINPNLFLVLERTKFGGLQKEKVHRKMIFDAVNEILAEKLDSVCLGVENPRELLKDVCLEVEKKGERCNGDEVERILREDVGRRSENWAGFYGGNAAVGVEVEWLIFRDLVNELVTSEGVNSC